MKNWPLWEVFIRSKNGLEHRHCGSLHASDATMALENAPNGVRINAVAAGLVTTDTSSNPFLTHSPLGNWFHGEIPDLISKRSDGRICR